jgi:hypothetical protein
MKERDFIRYLIEQGIIDGPFYNVGPHYIYTSGCGCCSNSVELSDEMVALLVEIDGETK